MATNLPQNYKTLGQAPLDAKLVIVNREILDGIIADQPVAYAFNFYKGMKVYLQEEEKLYIWEYVFSESYKENDKLLSQDYIYPQGTIYEGLDYSGKAYNLIEIPARKENIGVWDIDSEELIVEVVIYENSSINPFVVGDILNLWPNTERIAFIGGNITGLKLSGQPVQLYDEFFVSDWNNLSYDIQVPGSEYIQTARIKLVMPGEIIDYTQYMDILGNSFKAARIVHDELEMEHKSSIYFKPNGTTFEIHVVDKLGVKRSFIGNSDGGGQPGPKGDKPAHEWNATLLRFENPNGTWGSYVNLQGPKGDDPDTSKFVTINTPQPITATKTFTEAQIIQGFRHEAYVPNNQIRIVTGNKVYDSRFLNMNLFGTRLFEKLIIDEEVYNNPSFGQVYSSKYLGFGEDIFRDHTGDSDYRPGHPAHDSFVGVGYHLGAGIEDGTNNIMFGVGLMHLNDTKYTDSITLMGKGNTSGRPIYLQPPLDPNRVVYPVSEPSNNIRALMNQVVVIGSENWCSDWNQSVIIGCNNKTYDYFHRSIVIGTENQNFQSKTGIHFDNDIFIGNGLDRAKIKYKPTHNLVIGSTVNANESYIPLVEGYMKHDNDPFFGINGRLELRNTDANELLEHSDNLVDVVTISGFIEEVENSIFRTENSSGTITTTQSVVAGKTYIIMLKTLESVNGIWDYEVNGVTDNNNDGSSIGQMYNSTKFFTATANDNLVINTTANSTNKIQVTLYEINLASKSDSILTVIDSDKNITFEGRFGKANLNNIFLGKSSGEKNVVGTGLIGIGSNTLSKVLTLSNCIAIGNNAASEGAELRTIIAIGTDTLRKYNNGRNVAIGYKSQEVNINGVGNTSLGFLSLQNVTSGYNTSIGDASLLSATTGDINIGIGFFAGFELTTGSHNIYIGKRTTASSGSVVNEIVVGSGVPATLPEIGDPTYPNIGKGSHTAKFGNEKTSKTYTYGILYNNDVELNRYLTQAQYDSLSTLEKNNGTNYFIEA